MGPERTDFGPDRADFGLERADFGLERTDMRALRALRALRADLRTDLKLERVPKGLEGWIFMDVCIF